MPEFDNSGVSNEFSAGMGRRDVLRYGAGAAALSALASSGAVFGQASVRPALAEIGHGRLRGAITGGVKSFKGIPYGAPTGGASRFLRPQPAAKWAGVRDATKVGDTAPQGSANGGPQSEDCLTLHVWAPERPKSAGKLPVMVWLHGGGYASGSANEPLYDGSNLAREGDVIVVGVNSRLNIFGFSYFETTDERFASSGNLGLLDIVQSLQWIRDNIAAFGGDSGNVLIFGESGGACKVNMLLGMPAAQGLFHKAIVQSGRLLDLRRPELASRMTDKLFARLDIKRGDIAMLQQVPTRILADLNASVSEEASPPLGNQIAFGPTVDGVVFKQQPWAAGAPEHTRNIPMLVGTTLDEQVGWIGGDIDKQYPNDEAMAAAAIKGLRFTSSATGATPPLNVMMEIIAATRKELPDLSMAERLVRVSSDASYRAAAIHQGELRVQRGGAPLYFYELRWRSPQRFAGLWAPHGADLPIVFGSNRSFDDFPMAPVGKEQQYEVFQRLVMSAWAAFARSGNPSTPELQWPAYDLTSRPTMILDGVSKVENDPRPLIRKATEQMYKSGSPLTFDGAAPT
jgi:para-nitrobenzyl esterase